MANDAGVGRDGLEPGAHAFVLKVWCEEEGRPMWRGRLTHVASGTRHPVLRLEDLGLIVGGYLVQLGIRLPLRWRLRRWLGHPRHQP